MRLAIFLVSALLLVPSLAFAQTAPPRPPRPRTRPALPPLAKPNPDSPAQAGRTQLYRYLDAIAARDEAARSATVASIHTRAAAEARQREVHRKILALLGGLPAKTPLDPRITGTTQLDGFRIEKVLYDSQPNFAVTALLYVPDAKPGAPARLPAIVMAPGHSATGKAGDFSMASTFARNGFVVLSYDPIGQGERLQYPDPNHPGRSLATRPTGEHGEAGLQPTLIGDAVARYFAWDGIRAVDYLLTRPEVDPNRIGAFGCSGGGAMTALLGGLDPRLHAIATACYFTSFDTLLPSIGPQDAEQSIPDFIASGLGFPDWIELAPPRPYAMVGTVSDMFPWAGFLHTAKEARRFYSLYNPAAEGKPTGNPPPPTPTGPALNPDTSNLISPTSPFQVIAGIGGHGNLRPLTAQIVSFFLLNLAHSNAAPILPPPPAPGASPFAPPNIPPGTLQVTPTGQVATSYPGCATVHSLNLVRAAEKLPKNPKPLTLPELRAAIRQVTHAIAVPQTAHAAASESSTSQRSLTIVSTRDYTLPADFYPATGPGRHPAVLFLLSTLQDTTHPEDQQAIDALVRSGSDVLAFTPRPSPPGSEETKSPILGPFYLTELRAELTGNTLLGLRVDDVIHALDTLAAQPGVDPNKITAQATGHMGLVLLHAAVLDPRLKHISISHTLESYHSLLEAPMPIGAPQDILPGVLLHYDIPALVHALGPRLTATDWLPGTADLSAPGTLAPPPAQP